jgi:hypothetical protein
MFEKKKDWAISSEGSLETKINVQRLLKLPIFRVQMKNLELEMELVNHSIGNVVMRHETKKTFFFDEIV